MEYNAKRKIMGTIIYVVCAFMLVTLLCVAIITALTGGLQKATQKPSQALENAALDTEKPTAKPELDIETEADKPTGTLPEGEPTEDTQASAAVSAPPAKYQMPVESFVSKHYDLEMAVYSLTMDDYRVHSGIDIECEVGTEVSAFADGSVATVWRDQFMGYCIALEHSGGMKSYYMNLAPECAEGITEGTAVKCGQVIAYVGDSAALEAAQSPHLHFEVTVNGAKVDPLSYLDYDESAYLPNPDSEG